MNKSADINDEFFRRSLKQSAAGVERVLERLLPEPHGSEAHVARAMRHATLAGGKMFRPFLVRQSARLFAVRDESALRVAAAVECVHAYSLIHDDLPCMDDDDLRRGKPATHRAFGEAAALLAGDALLTLAFEILAHHDTHEDTRIRCDLVAALAGATGMHGMIAGQAIDISQNDDTSIAAITRMQRLKTGALIAASCEAGAILGNASHDARIALNAYAHNIGLAFQITDDLLDIAGDPGLMGKSAGKDAPAGKASFASVLGVDRARKQARILADQAVQHLHGFGQNADLLRHAAHFVINRQA